MKFFKRALLSIFCFLFIFQGFGQVQYESEKRFNTEQFKYLQSGYENFTGFNVSFLTGFNLDFNKNYQTGMAYGFSTVNGYRFNPADVYVGVGVEYSTYPNLVHPIKGYRSIISQLSTLPLYFDIRINILRKKITPFLQLDIGYTWAWLKKGYPDKVEPNSYGGFMIKPSLGIKIYIANYIAINFSIGFRYQKLIHSYTYIDPYTAERCSYDYIRAYNFGVFKIEFSFFSSLQ
jgi:hypothetical protein